MGDWAYTLKYKDEFPEHFGKIEKKDEFLQTDSVNPNKEMINLEKNWEYVEPKLRDELAKKNLWKEKMSDKANQVKKSYQERSNAEKYLDKNYMQYKGTFKIGDFYYVLTDGSNILSSTKMNLSNHGNFVVKLKCINELISDDKPTFLFKNDLGNEFVIKEGQYKVWHRKGGLLNSKSAEKLFHAPINFQEQKSLKNKIGSFGRFSDKRFRGGLVTRRRRKMTSKRIRRRMTSKRRRRRKMTSKRKLC
jgi:hypothetical protein